MKVKLDISVLIEDHEIDLVNLRRTAEEIELEDVPKFFDFVRSIGAEVTDVELSKSTKNEMR